nr:hypothetical protein CFP56_36664 [Quercus suber]
MPPKKKRVANSNSEEPIVNLRRPIKARVDTEAEITQDVRNNERLRVTRTDPLDEAATQLLDRLAHVASRGTGRVEARENLDVDRDDIQTGNNGDSLESSASAKRRHVREMFDETKRAMGEFMDDMIDRMWEEYMRRRG